jgi:hypothetical protein
MKIDDQIAVTFLGIIDEAMSILQAEEATTVVASSSIRRLKHRQHYVNRDCETAYFRL